MTRNSSAIRGFLSTLALLSGMGWWAAPAWGLNNGFDQNAAYAITTSDSALVAINETTGATQATLIAGVVFNPGPSGPFPDAWATMTFSGTTANNDARLFIAKDSPRQLKVANGYPFDRSPTDVVIREVNSSGGTVRELSLKTYYGVTQLGPNVRIGSIRYSPYHNSLFVSADLNFKDHGQYALIYELDLNLTTVKNVYWGGQSHQEEPNIGINLVDGTIYMCEMYMNVPSTTTNNQSSTPHGDLVSIDTHTGNVTAIVAGPTFFAFYQPNYAATGVIDSAQIDWTKPECPIYRGTFNPSGRPTLLATISGTPGSFGGPSNVKQPEFYLDQTTTATNSQTLRGWPYSEGSNWPWRGQLDEISGNVLINVLTERGIVVLHPDDTHTFIGGNIGYQDVASPGRTITPLPFVPNYTYVPAGKPQIDPSDPHRYVMDGKEWYLAGYYMGLGSMYIEADTWKDSLGEIGQGIPMLDTVEQRHNKFSANGINYYRGMFSAGQSISAPANKVVQPSQETMPYLRSSTTGAADGGNKFDLNTWNQAHFDYWKNVLADAQSRGIVIQLCIFDSWHLNQFTRSGGDPYGLKYDFYAANMNINGCNAATENDWHAIDPTPSNDADDAPIMREQKRLIRKVVDELGGYPNIIWEVINEPRPYYDGNDNYGPPASDPNANAFAMQLGTYLKNYEQSTRGSTHICMPSDLPDHQHVAGQRPDLLMTQTVETDCQTASGTHRDMKKQFNLDHTFAWWPQTAVPLIADNDAPGSEGMTPFERGQKTWGQLTAGGYSDWFHSNMSLFSMDTDDGMSLVGMTHIFHEALKVKLQGMVPHDDLVTNSKWCVARANQEFVVYFVGGGSTTISQLPATRAVNKWFDPLTGAISNAPSSGSTFTAPGSGDWVLYISDTDHSSANNPPTITQEPSNQTVNAGQTANFTVAASGSGTLTYQWQKNSVNLSNGGHVSGATTTTLTISSTDATDVGTYRCVVTNAYGTATSNGATLSLSVAQSPYGGTAWAIPGTVQAENYDLGGEGVASHDTTSGNTGGAYRTDDVDLEATTDAGGGYNVGWIAAGEWLEYTVNVAAAGNYDITLRTYAFFDDRQIQLQMTGVDRTVSFNTSSGYVDTVIFGVALTAGQQILRIDALTDGFNLNRISFANSPTALDDAQVVSGTVPISMTTGQVVSVSITMQNIGTSTWTQAANYKLGGVGDNDPFAPTRQLLGGADSIAPGQSKTFTFNMTAPTTPGTYVTDWQMLVEGVHWFGGTYTQTVVVSAPSGITYSDTFANNPGTLSGRAIETGGVNWAASSMQVASGQAQPSGGTWRVKANIPINSSGATSVAVNADMRDNVSGSMVLILTGTSLGDFDTTNGGLYVEVARAGDWYIRSVTGGNVTTHHNGGVISGWVIGSTHKFELILTVATKLVTVKMDGSALVSNVSLGSFTPTLTYAGWQARRLQDTQTFASGDAHFDNFNCAVTGSGTQPPTITAQPQSITNATPGTTVQFTVAATGGTLTYQWRKGTTNLVNAGNISGATSATLSISSVSNSDEATNYNCVVTNAGGSTTSANASLTVLDPPTITDQPDSVVMAAGQSTTFSVIASGAGTLTYQWQKNSVNISNGGDISGATTASLSIANTDAADAGTYRCVVGNAAGSVNSNGATLNVDDAQFVSSTIPTTMTTGQVLSVNVVMKNIGTTTWTQAGNFKLGGVNDSDPFGPARQLLGGSDAIGNNQSKTFTFAMTAPSTPGTYLTDWRMLVENVHWFGQTFSQNVVVSNPAATYSDNFTSNSANLNGRVIETGGVTWSGLGMQVSGGKAIPLTGNWRVKGDIPIATSGSTTISVKVTMHDNVSGSMFLGMPANAAGDFDTTNGGLYLEVARAGDYYIKSVVGGGPNTIFSGGTIPGWVINSLHTFEFIYNTSAKTVTIKMDGSALVSNVSIGTYTPTLGRAGFQGKRLNSGQTFATTDIDFDTFVTTITY